MDDPLDDPPMVRRLREARAATNAKLGLVPTDRDPLCLIGRLRAAAAKRPPRDLSHLDDLDAHMARIKARWDEEYKQYCEKYAAEHPGYGEEAEAEPPARRTRQRKPSIASAIKQARKAGERGPVRVTLPDGTTITITSEREGSDVAAAINPWDKVLKTNATH